MGSNAGSVGVSEGSVEEGMISLSIGLGLTLVELAHGGDGEGGGDVLVGSSSWAPVVRSISVGSVSIGSISGGVEQRWVSLSFGFTLVELAHGGDGEGGGHGLVGSGSWAPVVWGVCVWSISIGSISSSVEERWVSLSFSFTLSKVVSSVSVVVGVAVVTIAIGSITSIGVGSISTIGVGSGSVTGIEKSWVGLSFGFSSDSCNTGKSYDLETKR